MYIKLDKPLWLMKSFFSFKFVAEDLVWKEIMNLDGSKATLYRYILHYFEVNCWYSTSIINRQHKLAEVSPNSNQKYQLDKKNYMPVSFLPHASQVFEEHASWDKWIMTVNYQCN